MAGVAGMVVLPVVTGGVVDGGVVLPVLVAKIVEILPDAVIGTFFISPGGTIADVPVAICR